MKQEKGLAQERIAILFKLASITPNKADRYVTLARKIAMKARTSIPTKYKRTYCNHCYTYFQQGKNCRVRNHKGRIIYYCLTCKHYKRFIIKK
ncbi:MAG: ribonuclease P [Nanoarchaeota archaeon]|nr:ribonuclease P [Nanoarchaeota archaeon]